MKDVTFKDPGFPAISLMSPRAQLLCDRIDAAMFSSDTFHNAHDLAGLRAYMARWVREIETSQGRP